MASGGRKVEANSKYCCAKALEELKSSNQKLEQRAKVLQVINKSSSQMMKDLGELMVAVFNELITKGFNLKQLDSVKDVISDNSLSALSE